jgi:flagellar M-ring protein FliF
MSKNLLQLAVQLREIWKQLGLNQKVSVVAAAILVLGGLLGLAIWSNRADYSLLYGHMEDGEAAKVIAALDEAKIPYKTSAGNGSIYVPSDKVHTVRMQLAGKGVGRGDMVGYEIFDKPNFGLSDFVQRANYLRAIQGELARTISQLNEIAMARVMIVMPENRLLVDNQKHPTASVFVKVKGNSQLDAQGINSIRFLVANAVEGLQANHVTVVDNLGHVLSESSEPDSLAGLSASQLATRQQLEKYLSRKAEDMLIPVVGPGGAVVRVSADINFDTKNTTTETYDPDGQVARNTTIEDTSTTSMTAGAPTAAGVSANANLDAATNANATTSAPQTTSQTKKKNTTSSFDVSKTVSVSQKTPGDIKRLSAAVVVASKIEGTGADRKVVPRTEDELKSIKAIVQSALGVQQTNSTERVDEITLVEMPFNDTVANELNKQLDQQQKQIFYSDLVRNVAYPGIALAVLFLFWRTFKRTVPESLPVGIPVSQFSGNGTGNGQRNGNGNGAAVPEPGVVSVDVLNRLVRENPDNMSQAIRTWLTRGQKPGAKN